MTSLTACETASSNPPLVKIVCPIIKEYTPEQQAQALVEFAKVSKDFPEITRYVKDYADLREKIRVCEGMR